MLVQIYIYSLGRNRTTFHVPLVVGMRGVRLTTTLESFGREALDIHRTSIGPKYHVQKLLEVILRYKYGFMYGVRDTVYYRSFFDIESFHTNRWCGRILHR